MAYNGPDRQVTAVARIGLPYILSEKEYKALHKQILSRSKTLQKSTPSVSQVESIFHGRAPPSISSATRDSLRIFLGTQAGLKAWAAISRRFFGGEPAKNFDGRFWQSPNFKISFSLSSILFFHRVLFRLFAWIRAQLLKSNDQQSNLIKKILTSKFTPGITASVAGALLGIFPVQQVRVTAAIFFLCEAARATYDVLEDKGLIWKKEGDEVKRPWWFGSWMLFPVAFGQLFHTFVFDREYFPPGYGNFILKHSAQYIPTQPEGYSGEKPWPGSYEIVDRLAEVARLGYPASSLPEDLLPVPSLAPSSTLLAPANTTISSFTHPLLHATGDHLKAYILHWIKTFPKVAQFFGVIFAAFSLPQYRSFLKEPVPSFARLASSIVRMSAFVTGLIGTTWGSLRLFQRVLAGDRLPTERFFLSGFLGGLWVILMKDSGRDNFLYVARTSIESTWNVGKKKGWWNGVNHGELAIFVASLAVLNTIYTRDPESVKSGFSKGFVGGLRAHSEEENEEKRD